MANEFIARKGIISLDSIQVSGSISATGGITISGSISSASFATSAATASSADNFFVRQNLTASSALFTGSITAQTLVVQTVTSSITYSSGSNIFGNLPSNVQQFTGSLRVTGSGNHFILGGNVGIGTSSPTRILDISGSAGVLRIQNGGSVGAPSLELGVQNQGSGLFAPATNTVAITTNDTERMRITSGGNVGIGTSSPNTALQVNLCSGTAYSSGATGNAITIYNTCAINNQYVGLILQGEPTAGNAGQATIYGITTGGGAMDMAFSTRGSSVLSERMRITSAGDVGIGTTSPQNYAGYTSLTIGDNDVNKRGLLKFKSCFNSGAGAEIFQSTAGVLSFSTTGAGVEMAINCSGAVGIGCSTPSYRLDILDTCASGVRGLRVSTASSSVGPSIILNYCPGGLTNWLIGTSQAVSRTLEFIASNALGGDPGASGTTRMLITCGGEVGIKTTSTSTEANLFLGAQGTVEGGQLVLQKGTSCSCATHLDNYQNSFRIMSGTDTGSTTVNVLVDHVQRFLAVGRTIPFAVFGDSNGIVQYGDGSIYAAASNTEALGLSRIGTDGAVAIFRRSTTTVGSICVTASATSFNTSSDYRLKTDLKSFNGVCLIARIKPYDFKWKVNCDRMYGFIAHELAEVLPYVVSGEKDGEEMQSLDYSKLTPVLVKAIQEQQCQICTQSIIIDQLKTCLGII